MTVQENKIAALVAMVPGRGGNMTKTVWGLVAFISFVFIYKLYSRKPMMRKPGKTVVAGIRG